MLLLALLSVSSTGCRMFNSAVSVPQRTVNVFFPGGRSDQPDPAYLLQSLMNYSDRYSAQVNRSVDELTDVEGSPFDARSAIQFKIDNGQATLSIVSNVDPNASLFDMVSFVTLTRMVLEDHWVTGEKGHLYEKWLNRTRRQETNLWGIVDQVLRQEQQEELRKAVEAYYRDNPDICGALRTQPQELASAIPRRVGSVEDSRNLFSLDPFASLDPVTRELTESRLFAKRATFVLTRMPELLRWQSELLLMDSTAQPAVAQIIQNSTSMSESLDRASRAAAELPDHISSEREALVQALTDQQSELTELIGAATAMSESMTDTVTNTIRLVQLFGVGETNRAPGTTSTNSKPFDITEYTVAAREMATLASELDSLVNSLDIALESPSLQKATERAETSTRRVLNHAFLIGAGLLVLAFILALIFKAIVRNWTPSDSP
jgi:hypothetical protein